MRPWRDPHGESILSDGASGGRTVEVAGLDNLAAEAACRGKNIVLYLDDRQLSDVVAFPPSNPNQQILRFPLRRTEASRDFQMLAWTIVLGIIFCGQVYQALAMPEFGETLLPLTGISAARISG
jgi:hypothetical protein